jgi:hypothetical protein
VTGLAPTRKSEVLSQHFIGRDNLRSCPLGGQRQCQPVGAVGEIRKSNPVKRVGKKRRYTSRFGQP